MSNTSCGCDNLPVVKYVIPGPVGMQGADGVDGADGINSFTDLTASFIQPAVNANVTIDVTDGSFLGLGQFIWIEQGGTYEVITINSALSITVENLGYTGNAPPTTVIPATAKVSPSGIKGVDGSVAGGDLLSTNNLNDVASFVTSRSNLGLVKGTAHTNTPQVDDAAGLTNGEAVFATAAGLESKTAAASRTALGLVTGTDVQAFDALLQAIAALVTAADQTIYSTGVNTVAMTALTAYARTILDDADAATARVTLGRVMPRYGLLGSGTALNMNAPASDNLIAITATRYVVRRIVIEAATATLAAATAGLFTGAGGIGTIAADQTTANATTANKFVDLTISSIGLTDILTGVNVYFRVGTASAGPATANVWIFGEDFS